MVKDITIISLFYIMLSNFNVYVCVKVDFIWINRDQKCFEWFLSLLANLEAEQMRGGAMEKRLIDIQLYMTSAASKTDMKGLGLQLALELLHNSENRDVITGLQTRTMPGHPDWHKVI